MVYVIWGLLGILSLLKNNNKIVSMLITVFIMCVFCFNTANPDLDNYVAQYNGLGFSFTEPLFVLLGYLFYSADFSFVFFRFFLVSVCLLFTIKTIYRYSPYPTLLLFLYTIYPMTIDVVQIRFFVGHSIVFFALKYLVNFQSEKKNKFIIFFFLSILIAAGCHYGCILYAILGVTFFDFKKHKILFFIVIPLTFIVLITFLGRLTPYFMDILGSTKADMWLGTDKNASGQNMLRVLVMRSMPLLFSIFLTYINRNLVFKEVYGTFGKRGFSVFFTNTKLDITHTFNKFFEPQTNSCFFVCMYYIFLFSFLEITNASEYERLARLGLLIGSLLLSRQVCYLTYHNRIISQGLLVLFFIAYFVSIMFFMGTGAQSLYIDGVFRRVMENNSLFGTTY